MNPRAFLNLADDLATGPDESYWRSAVSRGYYACFHAARQLLIQCGFVAPHADGTHTYVSWRLSNCGNPLIVQAGQKLNALRQDRNRADYDLDQPFPHIDAVKLVQVAADILQIIEDGMTTAGICDEITVKMREYERDVLRQMTWRASVSP
jgi:uncharacterized protein (UPF0332 family)